jgi:hypothetical protein
MAAYGSGVAVDRGTSSLWTQLDTADPDNTGNTMVDRGL